MSISASLIAQVFVCLPDPPISQPPDVYLVLLPGMLLISIISQVCHHLSVPSTFIASLTPNILDVFCPYAVLSSLSH
jgi:hypothetical protein